MTDSTQPTAYLNCDSVATESSIQFRRLSDLLSEIQLLEAQLQVLREDAGPHLIRNIGLRIAALHGRLDQAEHRLRLHTSDVNDSQLSRPQQRRSQALRLASVPARIRLAQATKRG